MIKIHVIHTGKVYVSPALPVSAYLIEHPKGLLIFDTGWHREVSPNGEYDRLAQVKHMGVGHFLLNQAILPKGEALSSLGWVSQLIWPVTRASSVVRSPQAMSMAAPLTSTSRASCCRVG